MRRPGSRDAIKPCGLISEKLGAIFEVPVNSCEAIDALLLQLERKLS